MELFDKTFEELTREELYALLKARAAVFVVEQNCPYQDLDGRDAEGRHLWLADEDGIAAYLRILPEGEGCVRIGRVLTTRRGEGLGARILSAGIRSACAKMGARRITVEAQTYAAGFYEKQGFRRTGAEFLEDGIPHIPMTLDL